MRSELAVPIQHRGQSLAHDQGHHRARLRTHRQAHPYLQHPFLDREGGRVIYLEGSYVNTFSGNPHPTP